MARGLSATPDLVCTHRKLAPTFLRNNPARLWVQIPELPALKAMKVNDLKDLCKSNGLSPKGNKPDLIAALDSARVVGGLREVPTHSFVFMDTLTTLSKLLWKACSDGGLSITFFQTVLWGTSCSIHHQQIAVLYQLRRSPRQSQAGRPCFPSTRLVF
jgi:hypothetical protein